MTSIKAGTAGSPMAASVCAARRRRTNWRFAETRHQRGDQHRSGDRQSLREVLGRDADRPVPDRGAEKAVEVLFHRARALLPHRPRPPPDPGQHRFGLSLGQTEVARQVGTIAVAIEDLHGDQLGQQILPSDAVEQVVARHIRGPRRRAREQPPRRVDGLASRRDEHFAIALQDQQQRHGQRLAGRIQRVTALLLPGETDCQTLELRRRQAVPVQVDRRGQQPQRLVGGGPAWRHVLHLGEPLSRGSLAVRALLRPPPVTHSIAARPRPRGRRLAET